MAHTSMCECESVLSLSLLTSHQQTMYNIGLIGGLSQRHQTKVGYTLDRSPVQQQPFTLIVTPTGNLK